MKIFTFIPDGQQDCRVTACLQTELEGCLQRMHPGIVICPGGGYAGISQREGEPAAKKYFAAGYNTFLLEYSVGEDASGMRPLRQLAATIAHIRNNSVHWAVDPNRLAVCGFSAGGHLAASLGVLHNDERFLGLCGDLGYVRPDAMVLGYPVITADDFTHKPTIQRVSGNAPEGSEEYSYFGLDKHVDDQTPPAFLWHTAEDRVVPVHNSLKMAQAMADAGVPVELHVLPNGGHGMATCTQETCSMSAYNSRWMDWSIIWLNSVFEFEE